MSTVTTIQEGTFEQKPLRVKKKKKISWEAFQKEYLTREDGYKYEWLNGVVEKTKRTMDYTQIYILKNLLNLFQELKAAGKLSGYLISEVDTFFDTHHRRPNIAYFTDEQIDKGKNGDAPVPQFVIEVISKNDKIRKVNKKMDDYRNAEVQVVWQIFPGMKQVHVNVGIDSKVYKEGDIVSAAPALPDFEMKVADVFK